MNIILEHKAIFVSNYIFQESFAQGFHIDAFKLCNAISCKLNVWTFISES